MSETKSNSRVITIDWMKFILYIITLVVAVFIFYGAIDKRVTILETDIQHKVDDEKLFMKLEEMKKELLQEIKELTQARN